jgi:hypothetical protein
MARKRPQRRWTYAPRKPTPPAVPDVVKALVDAKAGVLVENHLKPTCIKPPPEDQRWNYLIDISTRWRRSFFYFIATYASPGPNALSPTFESPFSRLEYVGEGKFNLAYMRHTGKWWEVYRDLSPEEAMKTIQDESLFHPP